jgi:hypothetical protein
MEIAYRACELGLRSRFDCSQGIHRRRSQRDVVILFGDG